MKLLDTGLRRYDNIIGFMRLCKALKGRCRQGSPNTLISNWSEYHG